MEAPGGEPGYHGMEPRLGNKTFTTMPGPARHSMARFDLQTWMEMVRQT
ncbi:MAG: hypothetical protein ACWA5Q_10780 [bacterium]